MDASHLTNLAQYLHANPDLHPMLRSCSVVQNPSFERPVCVQPDGSLVCSSQQVTPASAWFLTRLALEVAELVSNPGAGAPARTVLPAGQRMARILLAAARLTARAWCGRMVFPASPPPHSMPCFWGEAMAGEAVPAPSQLAACLADVALYVAPSLRPQVGQGHGVYAWACSVWSSLQPAEWRVVQGGDERLDLTGPYGLNRYGCQPFPRSGELAFSSSTASSPTVVAARAMYQANMRLIRCAVEGGEGAELCPVREVRAFVAAFYHLDGPDRVVLAPSGTDCALAATAFMGMGSPHITTLLPGVEETGSGVPLATCGRHFAQRTALGHGVDKGTLIDGFVRDAEHVGLPLRAEGGARIPDDDLFATCQQQMDRALRAGRRVLLYLLHVSKTGQLVLPAAQVRALCALYPGQVDVLVDACQARLRAEHVRQYVGWGWAVMVTGSKFFTGPPFSGALLLPDGWLERLHHASLPAGLAAYATRAEWPDLPAALTLPAGMNAGLLLRWSGARAEMAAFAAVPETQKYDRLHRFGVDVLHALRACPYVRLLPSADLAPAHGVGAWDSLPSIFAFVVLLDGCPLTLVQARQLHGWLLADLTVPLCACLRDVAERALAALLCHVGQPVAITDNAGQEGALGALRISASARLVSGTGAMVGAARPEDQSEGMLCHAGVVRVLAKLELILRYWSELAHAPSCAGTPVERVPVPVAGDCVWDQGRQGISSLALRQS